MTVTELQKSVWESVGYESAATQKIRNNALQYYIEYRQYLKETHAFIENEKKIQTLFLIAYFISEKSEVVYDVQGNRITNIAFSINQLAKKHNDYKEFFYHLKEMMRKVTLPAEAKQSEEEINSFVKYFSFLMTFYNKFLSTFDKITICHNISVKDLENFGGEKQYKDKIKYFLWVLYISFRKVVFNNTMDTIGNTCLLACLFSYFVKTIYEQEKITSIYAPEIAQEYGTFPNQFEEIEDVWMNFFCLKDLKTYQEVRNVFLQFVESLSNKLPEINQPFLPKNVFLNIKKLQQFYHRNMAINQIDQSLLLSNLMSNQQKIRFTAFGARRKIGKFHSNNPIQCRRALNYDAEIKQQETMDTTKKEPIFLDQTSQKHLDVIKRVKASYTPTILIQATPISQFTIAYNWLFQKSLTHSQDGIELNLDQLLQFGYQKDSYQLDNASILQKRKLIEGIFLQILQELGQKSQENVKVATILALEVFYFIMNITNRQITQIVEILCVSWFAVWKGVDCLLNYDKTMPKNVKTHLLLLETTIVSTLIWKDEEFIQVSTDSDFLKHCPEFFYRFLHHIAYQVNFIGKLVGLPDALMDQSFIVSQYFLKQCICLMQDMNLDVIIMCSMYGVCKAKNSEIKFKSIIAAYREVNSIDEKAFQSIDSFQLGDENMNIIMFYNKVFLRNCKGLLLKIKEQKLENDKIINSTNYVLSPVKQIIPASYQSRSNNQATPNNAQMLFAYNESPLLRRNKKISLNKQSSIKEKNEELKNQGRKIFNDSQVLRQRSTNISEMIEKKFGNGKASTLIAKGHRPKQT